MTKREFTREEIAAALVNGEFSTEMAVYLNTMIRMIENTVLADYLNRGISALKLSEEQEAALSQIKAVITAEYSNPDRLDWTSHRVEGFVAIAETIWKMTILLRTHQVSITTLIDVLQAQGVFEKKYLSEEDVSIVSDPQNYREGGYTYGDTRELIYTGPNPAMQRYNRSSVGEDDVKKVFMSMMELGLVTF